MKHKHLKIDQRKIDFTNALMAKQIGATVVTNNLNEFRRIATRLPGLRIIALVTEV